ncbi:MAG: hypothetical protein EAZ97_01810 [Bacteroidetes bacterium]|nr:MAG: hypothetical protein EAZ97_01810 [Bacteroidota bacterium]
MFGILGKCWARKVLKKVVKYTFFDKEKYLCKKIAMQTIDKNQIPAHWIYETINGKTVFYRNFKQAFELLKKGFLQEPMACSALQALVVSCVVAFLMKNLDNKRYKVLFQELGLHLAKNDNLGLDISIFDKQKYSRKEFESKLFTDLVAETVIEVNIKADLSEFDNEDHYMSIKTQKLLDFGVKQVIWILTEKRAILVAEPNADWLRKSWNEEIDVLGCILNLNEILEEDEENW